MPVSFGYSVGDVVAIGTLAWNVYQSCKKAPESFGEISSEVLSLHVVLKEAEETLSAQRIPPEKREQLKAVGDGCRCILEDLDKLIKKYESLGTQSKRTWDRMRFGAEDISGLRSRLTSNTGLLNGLLTALISTSQANVEKMLGDFLQEFREGKRQSSVISNETVDSLSMEEKDIWRTIRKELEDIGITIAAFEANKAFILEWFANALASGAFEEGSFDEFPTSFEDFPTAAQRTDEPSEAGDSSPSKMGDGSSLDSGSDFENQILNSRVYRRALAKHMRRRLLKIQSDEEVQRKDVIHDRNPGSTIDETNAADGAAVSDDPETRPTMIDGFRDSANTPQILINQSIMKAIYTQHRTSITVLGMPSVSMHDDCFVVGDSQSRQYMLPFHFPDDCQPDVSSLLLGSGSTRTFTPLKALCDGTSSSVWLCDWHGLLPPNFVLSPMQCGPGARPEWIGKRLVVVKRMKKKWVGSSDECERLKELKSLCAISVHPNIIPLYDFFLLPGSKELYVVFQSMEGNLYHLIKARKGRPLAGGLVSSIFRQIVSGLHHIHTSGYCHRNMKPENVLVTTTAIYDYQSISPLATHNTPLEKDVVAIIKIADLRLARKTTSKPSVVDVDMWALGTIMAELVNLRPLFPGSGRIDQVARIYEILGDPSDDYGLDGRGRPRGGGQWSEGIEMARELGWAFPKMEPRDIFSLFEPSVPRQLIECISDMLKYDPNARITSQQCIDHPNLLEAIPKNIIPNPVPLLPRDSNQ